MDFNWGQGLGSSEVLESFFVSGYHASPVMYASTTALSSGSATKINFGNVKNQNPTGIAATYLSSNVITATNNNTTVEVTYHIVLSK